MGRNKTDIKCKVYKGVKVCTVSTPRGMTMQFSNPVNEIPKVNVKLYTSKDCTFCGQAKTKLDGVTKNMSSIVKVDVIDVESDSFMKNDSPRIELLPTIDIEGNTIVGIPDEDQLWKGILHAYQMA